MVSSAFSSTQQMQSAPGICSASPGTLPPIWIPPYQPIFVQSNWQVEDPFTGDFTRTDELWLEWDAGRNGWYGAIGTPYPYMWAEVKPDWSPGIAWILIGWSWHPIRIELWEFYATNPTNSETWAPEIFYRDHSRPPYHFWSQTLMIRA